MKYKKKPVEVEAIHFYYNDEESSKELNEFCGSHIKKGSEKQSPTLFVKTLEGNMRISDGDYIIKGVNGEFYPCKPDIFIKTYEPIDTTFGFGTAIELLEQGKLIRRKGWNGKGMFIIKQVPATINREIIPVMQSLPEAAKKEVLAGLGKINYTCQCLIYNSNTGRADSWVPSSSDIFAKDWEEVK